MNLDVESKGKDIALKAKHNSFTATPYSKEAVMMLTGDFGKFLRRARKNLNFKGDSRLITGIGKIKHWKAKLDEIIFVRRPAGMESGLGYSGTNANHITGTRDTQHDSCYTTFGRLEEMLVKDSLSQVEKRNLVKKPKPRRPPLICSYCQSIGHELLMKYGRAENLSYVTCICLEVNATNKKCVDYNQMVVMINMTCYISTLKPKNVKEALTNEYLTEALQEKLQ
ncbi:hypothetical protein M9H77_02575 [Catharanthus roseus]|uniref:Uncharacterized protein n=1 Tax=Catharanthus roseus TaxID=4058 RepID=A0ACC0C975_CATRO|nr:hypothetical protein M9H77_02575 [Catharanthus roseus]